MEDFVKEQLAVFSAKYNNGDEEITNVTEEMTRPDPNQSRAPVVKTESTTQSAKNK